MSTIQVEDFLPKYPNIFKSEVDLFNLYEEDFYEAIFKKKEFYSQKLPREEIKPEKGEPLKHQKIVAHFLSSKTPYDSLLLFHIMGTGKTCSAVTAIEQIKNEDSTIKGALILVRGDSLKKNFINELVNVCTKGQYIPENIDRYPTEMGKTGAINRMISEFYEFNTFEVFAKHINKMVENGEEDKIKERYSNMIIVIDEAHNLRLQTKTVSMYTGIHRNCFSLQT